MDAVIQWRKTSELIPLEDNPRRISRKDMARLVASIKQHGFWQHRPIAISTRTGQEIVICGNMRLKAAKRLKLKDDYRFEAIWKDPTKVLMSGCVALIEPNLSLFDTTPVAYGLQQIYKKRWIARYFQDCGIKVYADLNVSRKFQEYNRMGIPDGYNAFFTRGYADRISHLDEELDIARQISGLDTPNLIIYGGGAKAHEYCAKHNLVYVEQFMNNKKDGKK